MRTPIFSFAALVLATGLVAATQTIKVTPDTLASWTVVGTDKTALAAEKDLSLPANARLARNFAATEVAVKLVTQPVFSPDPQDWPVLEIGSAALILLQSEAEGRLALVIGNNTPVLLPIAIPLDDMGRSATPLEVIFARSGQEVIVSVSGQTLNYPADPLASSSLEVAASAGAGADWSLPDFELTVPDTGATTANGPDLSGGSSDLAGHGGIATSASRDALGGKLGLITANDPSNSSAGSAKASAPAPIDHSALEIFTPPAVRHSKVDTIRAAVAKTL